MYDPLPQAWQDLLVRKFGEPKRMVSKSLFEVEYVREARFFEELCRLELPNGRRLNDHDIDKYTPNASVLMTMGRIYKRRKMTWETVAEWRMISGRLCRTRCQIRDRQCLSYGMF
jgi:hypothetical protein